MPEVYNSTEVKAMMAAMLQSYAKSADVVSAQESNTQFLLWAAVLVFFMQCGFAMVEAGVVQMKNVKNMLLKNILDACIAGIVWYLFGYGVAYAEPGTGSQSDKFIGKAQSSGKAMFAFHIEDTAADYSDAGYAWAGWFFQYAFCAVAATIVSGAVAERCKLEAYLVYTFVITGFIYPVVVHWGWGVTGAFSAFNSNTGDLGPFKGGVMDFAGSTIVHLTGGVAGLVGAAVVGPRVGRFTASGAVAKIPSHSHPMIALGTFILWMGWYGFNCGSTLAIKGYGRDAARVAVTTTLSPAMCCITVVIVNRFISGRHFSLSGACNGILAGLVAITAGCSTVAPWAAIVIGFVAAFWYLGASNLLRRLKIDDPLDAFAVHGACGAWGTIAVGLFAEKSYTYNTKQLCGAYNNGCDGQLLEVQIAFVCSVTAWVAALSFVMFFTLKKLGLLRISSDEEDQGMDTFELGGSAYDFNSKQPVANLELEQHLGRQ